MPKPEPIYTLEEFSSADKLDRIYMHLVEPKWQLSLTDQESLNQLKAAWNAILHFPNQSSRIRHLEDTFQVTELKARLLLKEANQVFGDLTKLNFELELHMSRERYLKLMQKAEDAGDFDIARKCQESADKAMAEIERRAPAKKNVYTEYILTDNPKALQPRNEEYLDLPEIEYQDVTTPHISESEAKRVPSV